jgi:uncharacterized protein (TIGR02147 family)
MKVSVFDFNDYKAYLSAWIESKPGKGRGVKSRLAEKALCHPAYISQVLQGPAHFTLEQSALMSEYMGHTQEEEEFFLLLVQIGRAGNEKLRNHFQAKIKQILDKRLVLKNRLSFKKTLSEDKQAIFYSAWYYLAIYILLTIPEFRSREPIARHLSLSMEKVSEVLTFLTSIGLAVEKDGQYLVGEVNLHLGEGSPMLAKHHTNWRLQAIQSLDRTQAGELHYSSVSSASVKDIAKIRAVLVRAIEEARSIIEPSPEEQLFCYNLDLFKI